MINLFKIPAGDLSVQYLAQLFGTMNGIISTTSSGSPSGSLSLLGTMFMTFNGSVLTVAALIVVYTTVVGVMMTSAEGEFMGKKWNNIWLPIRMVLGIACLVPSGSGYSIIQMIFMWIIMQGIGAADVLWNTVLSYTQVTGSPYAAVTLPGVNAQQTITQLFQSVVCEVSARKQDPNPYGTAPGTYYCFDNGAKPICVSGPPPLDFKSNATTYQFGPNGACGTLNYCDENQLCSVADQTNMTNKIKCLACQGQRTALAQIIPTLRNIAGTLVDADQQYSQFFVDSTRPALAGQPPPRAPSWVQQYCNDNNIGRCTGISLPNPGLGEANLTTNVIDHIIYPNLIKKSLGEGNFITPIVSYYMDTVTAAVNQFITTQAQDTKNLGNFAKAGDQGWILAGAYYYQIAQMTGNNVSDSLPAFGMSGTDPTSTSSNEMNAYRSNYTAAVRLVSASVSTSTSGGSTSAALNQNIEGLGGVSDLIGNGMSSASGAFTQNVSKQSGSNPIAALVIVGRVLLGVAQALFLGLIGVTLGMTLAGYFDVYFLGTGANNPIGPSVSTIYLFMIPVILGLLGLLVSFGALLAVYLPMIPYIIFTFSAIGWFLMTIEAMVAGPLVALGILSPSGQHELLGKAEPAMMIVFFTFLRPSLMIFGLMSAMLLVMIMKEMIDAAYWQVMMSISGTTAAGGVPSPLELVLFLGSYIGLLIAAFNKCFQAIYLIPNQVMTWIGGSHAVRDMGEAAGLGEVKAAGEAAGRYAGGGMTGGLGHLKGAAESGRKLSVEGKKPKDDSLGGGETKPPPKGG